MPYQLSIYQATWKKKQHIDTVPTPSSFTGIFPSQHSSLLQSRVNPFGIFREITKMEKKWY